MIEKLIFSFFKFFVILCAAAFLFSVENAAASETQESILIEKISKDYTKKFCNAIAFGLSKESAMNFSIEENKKVFEKRKGINNIDKEDLAERVAISIVENCGYPINLSGDEGIKDFKNYYLSKYN